MSGSWPSGTVFAVFWLLLWLPVFVVSMAWFYARRSIQPIKARSPILVLITDAILVLYTISLCLQRIVDSNYPCLLNMWSGYVGTVVLFNSYLTRCWTLYFNFNLTHVRLQSYELNADNFFIKYRWLTGDLFLAKVALGVLVLLMLAPLVLTVNHPSIANEYGDGCDQFWGPTLLAVYVACYVALFLFFSFSLRSVVDGFMIKAELKATGVIALLAVIPWFAFNQAAQNLNNNTFPFSTMFLLIAIVAAFITSTIYPLYMSIIAGDNTQRQQQGATGGLNQTTGSGSRAFHALTPLDGGSTSNSTGGPVGGPSDRLYHILEDVGGCDAFTQFLTKEFSVENIVFYKEIEAFREAMRTTHLEAAEAGGDATEDGSPAAQSFVMQARKIHAKYIAVGAAFQVNLPDPVVRNCEVHLRFEGARHGVPELVRHTSKRMSNAPPPLPPVDLSQPPPAQQPPLDHLTYRDTRTLFDDSQRTIYALMEKDSMLRFVRSDLHRAWRDKQKEEMHKAQVLAEMNLV